MEGDGNHPGLRGEIVIGGQTQQDSRTPLSDDSPVDIRAPIITQYEFDCERYYSDITHIT